MPILDSKDKKYFISENYNYAFDKKSGNFARWGKTQDDDPEMAPCPEILDIEIATACDGIEGAPCKFCYKANKREGTQMSFETYEKLFEKIAPVVSIQIQLEDGRIISLPPNHLVTLSTGEACAISNIKVGDDITDLQISQPSKTMLTTPSY